MNEINESIAHISCQHCGKKWQVLNDEGTDWNEPATAELYQSEDHNCQQEG
jgi:hypothetical protein